MASQPVMDARREARLEEALSRMVEAGTLSDEEKDKMVSRMSHVARMRAASSRRQEVEQIKALQLQRKLEVERSRADRGPMGGSVYILQLKEERDDADAESVLLSETLTSLEVEEKQRKSERDVLKARLDKIVQEAKEALKPHIEQIQEEIRVLTEQLAEQASRLKQSQGDVRRAKGIHADAQAELARMEELKTREQVQYNKAAGLPETVKRQIEMVQTQIKQTQAMQERVLSRTRELTIQAQKMGTRYDSLVTQEKEAEAQRQKLMGQLAKKERSVGQYVEDIGQKQLTNEQLLEHQARLDMQRGHAEKAMRAVQEELQKQLRSKEALLRKLRRAEGEVKEVQDAIPPLAAIKEGIRLDIQKQILEKNKAAEMADGLKKEVDAVKEELTKSEMASRDIQDALMESSRELAAMEDEIARLKRDQDGRERTIRELASKRDNAGRQVSLRLLKYREGMELVQLKEMVIKDLKKQRKEALSRVSEFEQLFELVKNQRNKFMNLIQAASQSIAEMREKLKILDNEIDILRAESADMDSQLQKQRHDYQISQTERDQQQNEKNRKLQVFQQRQDMVDQQIAEMDKLNSVINRAERDMLRLKKSYEMAIEARNYTGIVLIDRNDELCILYEKANIQDEILRRGELLQKQREDEIRILRIEITDLERSIAATRKLVPEIPDLDTEVATLKMRLLEAQRESEQLSLALEDPENSDRWKRLDGPIPDKEELEAKITQLEERLNDKKEQLLERQLVLEEITGLADRLKAQAVEGRSRSLGLAKEINEYQGRIRTTTRKMMATVSELSMYQASCLKLKADQQQLETLVGEARVRMDRGLPPTEEAEREWFRMERQAEIVAKMRMEQEEFARLQDAEALGLKTTAEPRPNAYIPGEDPVGAPKPFAEYAPFKPALPGSTMRHVRKPKPREIIL